MAKYAELAAKLKYDDKGLIPAILQDYQNGEVLMCAYMNKESVQKTLETKLATFYSRSRQKMWIKGETSGHTQEVKEMFYDCDADCLVIKIKQNVAACHVGYRGCFFNKVDLATGEVSEVGTKVFKEEDVYKK